MEALLNYDWAALPNVLREIIQEPATNLTAAILLLVVASLLLLIVMVAAILLLTGSGEESEEGGEAAESIPVPQETAKEPEPRNPRGWVYSVAFWVFALMAVYVAVGVASSTNELCSSCHVRTAHVQADKKDPHKKADCVSCHETGTYIGRIFTDVPGRAVHIVAGLQGDTKGLSGVVSSQGCASCHRQQITGTATVTDRSLKVSHKEPLEAGAECIDCHRLDGGVVSDHVAGMAPCTRCHDGEIASIECSVCHIGDPAGAVRADRAKPKNGGTRLVSNPKCDGCHSDQSECDSCHGLRLPHSDQFKATGHAREATVDLWSNGGKRCGKCHYQDHNDCGECHEPFLAHSTIWIQGHGVNRSFASSCACHEKLRYDKEQPWCTVCHDTRPPGALP